jgi:hypothetical protein
MHSKHLKEKGLNALKRGLKEIYLSYFHAFKDTQGQFV